MNICVVSHKYPSVDQPYLQTFIRDQVHVINQRVGYHPRVIVPTPVVVPFTKRWHSSKSALLDAQISSRFQYISIPRRLTPAITGRNLSKGLLKLLDKRSDIIHVHWLYPNGLAIPYLKKAGYPCVLNIHGTDWHSTKDDPRFSTLIDKSLNSADIIVVSGEKIKSEILQRFPHLDIRVSYNYIDLDLFPVPDDDLKSEARSKLNFDPQKIHLLTVANLRPEKGIDVLLEAISKTNLDKICFHIIGQFGEGVYESAIIEKLNSLPSGLVKIHKPVPRDLIPSYYFASDAYLLPSRSEGFNVSLLEALSTGLPIIATKTGGASKVLGDGRGRLVTPDNSNELSESIRKLVNSPMKRNLKSRTYIENNFSLSHYSEFLDELYTHVHNNFHKKFS